MFRFKTFAIAVLVVAGLVMVPLGTASAGNKYANVIANAECTVYDTNVLVSALLEQKEKPGPGYYKVGKVTFILEEHFPGHPMFKKVDESTVTKDVNQKFEEVDPGEQVEVATHEYMNICNMVDANANAVRAVVEVEVLNSNPKRRAELIHTGRCISFPNPCKY